MKIITRRQSLLTINRCNQIRSDARNRDSRHEQTQRRAVLYFLGKEIPHDSGLRQRLPAKHGKRYSRDNHSIIRVALQVCPDS